MSKEEFEAQQAAKEAKWKEEALQREANKRKRKLRLEEERLRRDIDLGVDLPGLVVFRASIDL